MSFIHLKVHTEYSMSDGIVRINDLVKQAAAMSMPAVAVTDHHNLFGMVKFYRKALSAGVKPIIGADVVLREGKENYTVTFYCLNKTGYQNLTCLLSKAYLEGQYQSGKPSVCWEWISQYSEGLLVLSGGRLGDIGQAILAGREAVIEQRIERWMQQFPNRFYIELQRTGRQREEEYIAAVLPLAERYQCPVVATNDVRFVRQDDFEAHEARVCIHDSYVLNDSKRPQRYSEQQYLRSGEQMQTLFADIPEALENTYQIAQRCSLPLSLGEVHLPQFPIPEGMTTEQYLEKVSGQALDDYLNEKTLTEEQRKAYEARLKRELDVINQMGFPGYFLIVADFIQWAKEQKIPVGPGRGSGAGSLVAYVLKITTLDPLEHELLFERFLNPERISMPDFDIDFCMEKRDQVIDYVAGRYGREAVSQIITYGTMAAKAVVRDVGRVLGFPYGFCDKIAKLIPFELGITLEKALLQEPQLEDRYRNEEEVTTLIDLAMKLEGITRNAGKHAGGVVIAPGKLTDFAPLYCEADGSNLVTQFDKDDVEAVGLVKFDFLGLRTLTIIDWAVKSIGIDIEKIPLDDEKTFKLLQDCATTAVFQLESRGMKDLIRRLQPDSFEDITALVALFRPGPLQSGMVDDFIDRKHGRAAVVYPHPSLEKILKPTYGVILYQEQVMQIAQVLSGYTLGGADILRRAMGKKKPEEMAKQRQVFVKGAEENNVDAKTAEEIFDLVEKFAGYGFNKSHSAAYALIAYQTAYLKAHYPAEFMAAVLSSDMDNTDKVVGFVDECRHMKLVICPPNVNKGFYQFTVNAEGQIEYGLGAIKGAGEAAIEHVVEEREQNGLYKDLFDFCSRVDLHKVSRRVLEPLVRSGAMDSFNVNRATLFASINKAIQAAEQQRRNADAGQVDLFGGMQAADDAPVIDYVVAQDWNDQVRLQAEKETIGFYLSGHPLQSYQAELNKITTCTISELSRQTHKSATIAGMVIALRPIITKSGRRMAVLKLEDSTGVTEVTLFSKLFDEVREELQTDEIFIVRGKIEDDNFSGGVRVVAETVSHLDNKRQNLVKSVRLHFNHALPIEDQLQQLSQLIKPHVGGDCPVTIAYQADDAQAELRLGDQWKITVNEQLLQKLKDLCGKERVQLEY